MKNIKFVFCMNIFLYVNCGLISLVANLFKLLFFCVQKFYILKGDQKSI